MDTDLDISAADFNGSPYRLESIALFLAGAAGTIVTLSILLMLRDARDSGEPLRVVLMIVIGLGCAGFTIPLLHRAMRNWRITPSADLPRPLLDGLGLSSTDSAKQLEECMRSGVFPAITGRDNSDVLLNFFPGVEAAPFSVQVLVQHYLRVFARILLLLGGFLLALLLSSSSSHASFISLFFLAALLSTSFSARKLDGSSQVSSKSVLTTVFIAVGAPVLTIFLPDSIAASLPELNTVWPTMLIFAFYVTVAALFLAAVRDHFGEGRSTSAKFYKKTFAVSVHPGDLFSAAKDAAVAGVPYMGNGHCYRHVKPQIANGTKHGEIFGAYLKESPARIATESVSGNFSEILSDPRQRMLVAITAIGLASYFVFFFLLHQAAAQTTRLEVQFSQLPWLIATLSVGSYAFSSGHTLWGRIDYESTLSYVRLVGGFQRSSMSLGNTMTGNMHAQRENISFDNLRIIISVCAVRSMSFGLDGRRDLVALIGQNSHTNMVLNRVQEFIDQQSSMALMNSSEDAARGDQFRRLNEAMSGKSGRLENAARKPPPQLPED